MTIIVLPIQLLFSCVNLCRKYGILNQCAPGIIPIDNYICGRCRNFVVYSAVGSDKIIVENGSYKQYGVF